VNERKKVFVGRVGRAIDERTHKEHTMMWMIGSYQYDSLRNGKPNSLQLFYTVVVSRKTLSLVLQVHAECWICI
jgi:hypothetical protein